MRVEHDEAAVGDLHEDVVAAGGVGHHFLDATFHYSPREVSIPYLETNGRLRFSALLCVLPVYNANEPYS